MNYCNVCRNETVESHDSNCTKCEAQVVNGWLAAAYRHWREANERWGKCCGSLNYAFGRDEAPDARERGHLYFHGKHFEGSFEGTWVEYGASFHDDHARTYYNRDFDSYCDSEEYGEKIAYLDPEFWSKLEDQLDRAPEAAWNGDLCSCEHCGYHYISGNGPCCDGITSGENEGGDHDEA